MGTEQHIVQHRPRSSWLLVLVPLSFSILSIFYLFGAHYRSHNSNGNALLFDLDSSTYLWHAVLLGVASILAYRHPDRIFRSLFTVGLVLYGIKSIPFFLWSGPFAFIATWPLLLFIALSIVVLYGSAKLILIAVDRGSMSLLVGLLVVTVGVSAAAAYINVNDFAVKQRIIYKNNSMFETIEECSDYIFPKREQDCRRDFTEMHDRWKRQEAQQR